MRTRPAQTSTSTFTGDQAGVTFHPGVHTTAAAFTNTGTITLDADGDSSAVFVFQIGAALSSAAASKVVLTDGALANNVFWQVVGRDLARRRRQVRRDLPRGGRDHLRRRRLDQGPRAHAGYGRGDQQPLHRAHRRPDRAARDHRRWRDALHERHDAVDLGYDRRAGRQGSDRHRGWADPERDGRRRWCLERQRWRPHRRDPTTWWRRSPTRPRTSGPRPRSSPWTSRRPLVSINGGATRSTNDTTPSISGTTDEPLATGR